MLHATEVVPQQYFGVCSAMYRYIAPLRSFSVSNLVAFRGVYCKSVFLATSEADMNLHELPQHLLHLIY